MADVLVRTQQTTAPRAAAKPAAAATVKPATTEPKRLVDVAQFHNLPLAGTPMVSASVDKTLGSLDPMALALSKLETKGPGIAKGVNAIRFGTRVVGPTAWGLSAFLNIRLLGKALKDPTITPASKVALTVGTVANCLGAAASVVAGFPLKLANRIGLGQAGVLTANKVAGVLGGVGGNIFNVINLVETLRNPEAKPAARFFAKVGCVLGLVGFAFGSVALVSSMPWMAAVITKAPWLLGTATKVANILGVVGLGTWAGQLFLGKNEWLSNKLKGTILG